MQKVDNFSFSRDLYSSSNIFDFHELCARRSINLLFTERLFLFILSLLKVIDDEFDDEDEEDDDDDEVLDKKRKRGKKRR